MPKSSLTQFSKKKRETSYTSFNLSKEEIIDDFKTCWISREASLLGRREVLTGKGKFGIFGDGKEVPQVAMARAFRKGDFRSGYYRDQTFIFALGLSTIEQFFAQLYADTENDPFSGGRQMNSHFATPLIDSDGEWTRHVDLLNISADISSTGGQMARALGIAFASKKYRESETLNDTTSFSNNGNEVCFCTIGDASTSEGVFWETLNAAGVRQVPLAISVWDDGYGISVPVKYQTTKASISEAVKGFQSNESEKGIDIYTEKGWDYAALLEMYHKGIQKVREQHAPALFHVQELTQPQGHSTSGSHERYKSKERLLWEKEFDCILKMEEWMLASGIASREEVDTVKREAKSFVRKSRDKAWKAFNTPAQEKIKILEAVYEKIPSANDRIDELKKQLKRLIAPLITEALQNARRMTFALIDTDIDKAVQEELSSWIHQITSISNEHYHTKLFSESKYSALKVPVVDAEYNSESALVNGYQVLNHNFDKILETYSNVFAFGEDLGFIGDVNQAFAGLQKKYGEHRVFDTGIREWSIMGKAIGMAMRGMRPIAEIQYLDYLVFGLEPLMDDLCSLRYRSNGLQHAPAIIRTRGHRLEGVWHAGSPMGMLLATLRGMYVLVPRNMTQAAGFYNTMLQSNDPAIIVECLNGYRRKEKLPENVGRYTVPLGVPEILQEGSDITLVTYGACVLIAREGIKLLKEHGISVELIDVQTLIPFDLEHRIVESLKKTNRIIFMDEDVPGGATAYMMQEVLEMQNGYRHLDSVPVTLTAMEHRPPYGSNADYFSKPNAENVFEVVYRIMHEAEPERFRGIV